MIIDTRTKQFRSMRARAKYEGKTVPPLEWLEANYPKNMICPGCDRKMNWTSKEGKSTVISLQHNRDGTWGFLCRACNTRHAKFFADDFYKAPKDKKYCPRCKRTLPLVDFCTDNLKRWQNKKAYCRKCSTEMHYEWVKKNREAYRERRREKYYADKGLPVPGPSNHRRVKLS